MTKTTEAEAIPAPALREILREAIEWPAPKRKFAALRAVEGSERDGLRAALERWAHEQDSENLLD